MRSAFDFKEHDIRDNTHLHSLTFKNNSMILGDQSDRHDSM